MSYAFDTLAKAWERLRLQLPADVRDGPLAHRFGSTLEELHEADHRLRGAINRDDGVTAKARALDRVMNAQPDDEETYRIVRFFKDSVKPREVQREGVTLAEAQEHCRSDDSKGFGWFDGYEKE